MSLTSPVQLFRQAEKLSTAGLLAAVKVRSRTAREGQILNGIAAILLSNCDVFHGMYAL